MNNKFLWFGKYVAVIVDGKHSEQQQNQAGRSGLDYIRDVCTSQALDGLQYSDEPVFLVDEYRDMKEHVGICGTIEHVNTLISRCNYLIGIIDHWAAENASEGLKTAKEYMSAVRDMAAWQLNQLTEAEKRDFIVQSAAHTSGRIDTRPRLFKASIGYNRTKNNIFAAINRADLYQSLTKAGLFPEEKTEAESKRKAALLGAFLFGDDVPGAEIGRRLTIARGAVTKLAQFIKDLADDPIFKPWRADNGSVYNKAERWFEQCSGKTIKGTSLKSTYNKAASDAAIDGVIKDYFSVMTD
jgi:hypothetical protein